MEEKLAENQIELVLFDVGGVMTCGDDHSGYEACAELLKMGRSPEERKRLNDAIWKYREPYDLGGSDREYWDAVNQELGFPKPNEEQLAALVRLEESGSDRLRQDVIDFVFSLKDDGYRIAVLSNAPTCIANAIRRLEWTGRAFEKMYFSADLNLVKPDHQIYKVVCKGLEIAPEKVLFFDDRQENIDAAREVGLQAILWEDLHTGLDWHASVKQ